MSEVLVLRRARPPAIVPPLLSFTAGFIDSFTVLALFGLFVAQVTVVTSRRFPASSGRCHWLPSRSASARFHGLFAFRLFPGVSGRIPYVCLPDADPQRHAYPWLLRS